MLLATPGHSHRYESLSYRAQQSLEFCAHQQHATSLKRARQAQGSTEGIATPLQTATMLTNVLTMHKHRRTDLSVLVRCSTVQATRGGMMTLHSSKTTRINKFGTDTVC